MMNDRGIGVKPSPAPREPLYRLAGITTQRGADAPVQDLDYAYALPGVPNSANIVEINDHVLGEDLFYHDDIHNRLTVIGGIQEVFIDLPDLGDGTCSQDPECD